MVFALIGILLVVLVLYLIKKDQIKEEEELTLLEQKYVEPAFGSMYKGVEKIETEVSTEATQAVAEVVTEIKKV